MYNKIILGTAQFGMKYGIANNSGKIQYPEISRILNFLHKKKLNYQIQLLPMELVKKKLAIFIKKRKKNLK